MAVRTEKFSVFSLSKVGVHTYSEEYSIPQTYILNNISGGTDFIGEGLGVVPNEVHLRSLYEQTGFSPLIKMG